MTDHDPRAPWWWPDTRGAALLGLFILSAYVLRVSRPALGEEPSEFFKAIAQAVSAALKKGDTVRHRCAAEAMTVEFPREGAMNGHGLVCRTHATNPQEWLLIGDDGHPLPEPEA